MKSCKITSLFFCLFLMSLSLYATQARYTGNDYEIRLVYNREIAPGDPVFIEAQFILTPEYKGALSGKAKMIECSKGEVIKEVPFFEIKEKTVRNSKVIACMIPTSTYLKKSNYELLIEYTIEKKENSTFTLPLTYVPKKFVSEDIRLNQKNSAIKQDVSPERMDQIKRLNAILDTKNYDDYKKTSLTSFAEPLVCNRRTSFFGDRRKFIYVDGKSVTNLHYGIDYGVKTGNEVHACSNGKVVMAENRVSTGWSVCIEHLPGLYSLYYHMDSLNVKVGDTVKQGQLIGISGCTGLATGPHLHWEMRLNMEAVNPDWFVETYPAIFLQEKEKYFRQ